MKNISSKKFFLCISTILTCLTGCNPYKNMIKKKVIIKKQSLFNTIEQEKKKKYQSLLYGFMAHGHQ